MTHKCIITSCRLFLEGSSCAAVGDLYLSGDQFIFNANTDGLGRTVWYDPKQYGPMNSPTLKSVMLGFHDDYFERRGVFVFKASKSLLNVQAVAWIGDISGVPA
jgi:hypothetical protein